MVRKKTLTFLCLLFLMFTKTEAYDLSQILKAHSSACIGATIGFCANAFTRAYVKNNIVGAGAGAIACLIFKQDEASITASYAVGAILAKGTRHFVHAGYKFSAQFLRFLARKMQNMANYFSPDLIERAKALDGVRLAVVQERRP